MFLHAGCTRPYAARVRRALGLFVALAALTPAAAAAAPTANDVRFGEHPAFVRVVVDFSGSAFDENVVMTSDPRPGDGLTRLRLDVPGISTTAAAVTTGEGLRVRIAQGSGRLLVGIRSAAGRFKYVSYDVLPGGRLAIDLWKSAPPSAAAVVRQGPAGCLTLDALTVGAGTVNAAGGEHALFEHGLVTVLRGRTGRVLARKPRIAIGERWSTRLTYRTMRRQAGTFEAVAASAKDGSLVCLVQARVTLPASAGSSS